MHPAAAYWASFASAPSRARASWGDLYSLLFFGVLGWTMKQLKWPRPPLVLGFVLGDIIERYMFISVERYGASWLMRPVVAIVLGMALLGLLRPLVEDVKIHGGIRKMLTDFGAPVFHRSNLFYLFMIILIGGMLIDASTWNFSAKLVPMIVGSLALFFAVISLLNQIFRKPKSPEYVGVGDEAKGEVQQKIHMDLSSGTGHLETKVILQRAGLFFGWLLAFMASMATIGLIPTVPLFVILFMRIEGNERWKLVLPQAIGMTLFIYLLFDWLLAIPWPQTLLGTLIPALKVIPSV